MQASDRAPDGAQGPSLPRVDQHEKGSAMGLIKAAADARREKTARLKAQRLAQAASGADTTNEPASLAKTKAGAQKRVRRGKS